MSYSTSRHSGYTKVSGSFKSRPHVNIQIGHRAFIHNRAFLMKMQNEGKQITEMHFAKNDESKCNLSIWLKKHKLQSYENELLQINMTLDELLQINFDFKNVSDEKNDIFKGLCSDINMSKTIHKVRFKNAIYALQSNKENNEKDLSASDDKDDSKTNDQSKTIQIRHNYHWFGMRFKDDNDFYEFLDKQNAFGVLGENDIHIIRNYEDLQSDIKYGIVKYDKLDKWVPEYHETNTAEYKINYNDKGKIIKNDTIQSELESNGIIIGLRVHYKWLQCRFRWKWEFDKLLKDVGCTGLCDENNLFIVRRYEDLEMKNYRVIYCSNFDEFCYLNNKDPSIPKGYYDEPKDMNNENVTSRKILESQIKTSNKQYSKRLNKVSKNSSSWWGSGN
eukprot:252658_1